MRAWPRGGQRVRDRDGRAGVDDPEDGEELTADIWYCCFGVDPVSDHLVGPLA